MDFHTLPRKQLQALCKKNKIPANLTNVAMADSLNALDLVEGIEEIMNRSEMEVLKSPIGGRTRTAKTPVAAPTTGTRRRVAAASTSTRRKIEVSSKESLDEMEDGKRDVPTKTPAAAGPVSRTMATRETRRSTRLAANVGEPKERSEAIKISSYNDEVEENVEVEMKESSVDQNEIPEIIDLEKVEECSEEAEVVKSSDEPKESLEEKYDVPNEGDVVVECIEEIVAQEEDVVEIKEKVVSEAEVKSNDETKETSEEKSEIPNEEDVAESVEEIVATDFTIGNAQEEDVVGIEEEVVSEVVQECIVTENVCEMETEGLVEDNEMTSDVDEVIQASTEKDTEINSNMDEEDKASFEVNELKPNVDDDQTEASVEKDTDNDETNASMEEDAAMNLSVDEEIVVANETKASVEEDTDMNLPVDEDDVVAQFEVENEQQTSQNDQEKTSSEVIELKNETKGFYEEEIDQEKASFEASELKSIVDTETEASNEEDAEEIVVAQFEGADSFNVENEEHMIANVTVDLQEDETPDNEESAMSDEVDALDAEEMFDVDCLEEDDVVLPEAEILENGSCTPFKQEANEDETSNNEESVMSVEVENFDASDVDCQEDVAVPQDKIQENGNGTSFDEEANKESVMPEAEIEENGNVQVEIQAEVLNSVAEQVSNSSAIGDALVNNDDQEEMHVPEFEFQADLNSAIGDAPPVHNEAVEKSLSRTPLKSSVKKPKNGGRLNHISDDKENVGSGMKSVILKDKKPKKKDTWEDCSLRELIKRIKQLEISSQHKNEDGKENEDGNLKATTTRPALKPLSQN